MKKAYLLFLLAVPLISRGQEAFTLDKCIQYALENSPTMKNSHLDEKIASAKVKETVGIGLPQIDGNVGATNYANLPRFFGTKQRLFGFSGLPIDQYPNFYPELKDDDVLSAQNFFQLQASANANLTINQIIFNGSYLIGLKAASVYKDLAYKQTNQTKEQLIQSVMKAFYAALVNRARIGLFDNNIARVDSLLKNTKALNQNGFAESIDVDRTQVTLNNLVAERDKFIKLQTLTLEILKFQMNYPMDQPLTITGELTKEAVLVNLDDYLKDWDMKNRPDYQVLEANRRLQNLNVRNKVANGIPSLSFNANLGYNTQSNTIPGLFATNSPISENPVTHIGPDKWYPMNFYGLSLRVPLFSGLQRSYQVQQEKLRLQKIENSFRTLESGIDLEVKQATIQYQNAIETLQVQQRNMTLATNVANVTKIKYQQGVGSNIEVVDAESSLRESQINFYNALYEAFVARTDLDKAFGKLVQIEEKN
ncbi:MAG: TolC family protein [Bacteroidetes bacterium]|nr:TolC family protein [Bacteroidota bacterium]